MSLKVKCIKQAFIRGIIPLVIMGGITYFVSESDNPEAFWSMVAITIISTAVSAASAIYDYDVWPVKKKITVHTLLMLVTVYPALMISGWYDASKASGYIFAFISFVLWGVVLCSLGYFISKYVLKNIPDETKKN
ncbi:DUF3021 family protein [Streptococcus chenjunshii]|uniref:DUF3021 family protein n=1 Tax=Streptococcus chenjunshii TaxID=2173853 RepID=A0A372KPC3_9STRE|nr:DUF3021 family protein [Streptococcus chenjunshii]AXQ78593.1 DUF3021 family protein [Streptococcus chenjunshii]RFU51943.1 DUF3021 family protein [Streptococcus chenjunshii]RFU54135.1 DUF3021 family protein [Streptococcus chenjunshii]